MHVSVNLLAGVLPPSILRESVPLDAVVVVVVVVVHTRPRAIPLAMIPVKKLVHGFLFLSYKSMVLRFESFAIN